VLVGWKNRIVTLDVHEIFYARLIALLRLVTCKEYASFDRRDRSPDLRKLGELETDEIGCMGEAAVHKVANKWWSSAFFSTTDPVQNRPKDIGQYEIKTTIHANGHLIIKPDYPENTPYLLVQKRSETEFNLAGWIYAKDAKQDKYFKIRKKEFWVPDKDLKPFPIKGE